MNYTAQQAAAEIERARGINLRDLVPTGHGSGVILSERPGSPGVLGFGAVDTNGEAATLALDTTEAAALRDALGEWLTEQDGMRRG